MAIGDVHTMPVNDFTEHEYDDCPCAPEVVPVPRDDGSMGWAIHHHSLDGRELYERGESIPVEH